MLLACNFVVGESTAMLAVVEVYQAISCEVYLTVVSISNMVEIKIGSREWSFSAAVDHQVHQDDQEGQ